MTNSDDIDSTERTAAEPRPTSSRKPAILAVDDDPQVLAAIARDLRRQYAERFRIIRAPDGASALSTLEELTLADVPVALIVTDQRMPGITGVELLVKARETHPGTRMVLLTAYADIDAAIKAINEVHLDQYVTKPWDPPEERLYPAIDDILDDWEASYHPPFEGIRLVGHRWSPDSHRLRDFLSRNLVPFRWIDVDGAGGEAEQLRAAAHVDDLPLVVLSDGSYRVAPSNRELGEAIGLTPRSETRSFDLLVVGAGPAGLAAAVYGASEGLHTAVLESVAPGGQAGTSARIENYLGFPTGVSGADLSQRALDQARRLGAELISPTRVTGLTASDGYKLLALEDGATIASSAVIVASGITYRRLAVEGVDRLVGAGVFYGASIHEARAYEGEEVVVIGGANSAGQAALHFARFCKHVTIVVRAAALDASMSAYLVKQIAQTPTIEVRPSTQLSAVHGADHLEALEVVDAGGKTSTIPASGLFVFIGGEPCTSWLSGSIALDKHGFVLVGNELLADRHWREQREPMLLESSMPGVFAAGDARSRSIKRVASAVGDGAIAVHLVHRYLGL
jgi:thioredoxin reductase (NADPH)